MDNQNVLNNVSLEEASRLISKELIGKKLELMETRDKYYKERKQYESDYVAANDGDSSENAPLEAAINNLKMITGDIAANEAVIQSLESIEDKEYLIGTFDFNDIEDAFNFLNNLDKKSILEIYQIESGDVFVNGIKNIEISELVEKLNKHFEYNQTTNSSKSQLLFNKIKSYYDVLNKPKYNYCGLVVIYTTVRLRLSRGNSEPEVLTYKILPSGLSFLDIGAIAANSRVAQAVLGKQKGDVVTIQHSSGKMRLQYEILDIY